MSTEQQPPLEDSVIIVRWDPDIDRLVVDLGQVDTWSAATMLRLAADAVLDDNDLPLVVRDGETISVSDDDDDGE